MLLQHLSSFLPASTTGSIGENIYSHLAKWPVAVYLTTNFDNEVLRHLAIAGESTFIDSSNSSDHLSRLLPETSGLVVHLHGDLRLETGLILTSSQYQQILNAPEWEYWGAKMTAVFQMNRIIVIGHSLMSEVHRAGVTVKAIGFGIARQHICFNCREAAGAIVTIEIDRPDPRPVIGLFWFLLLRTPLSARCTLKELGTFFGWQLL